MNCQLIEQLMHAEEKMKIAHQEDVQRHEEIAMSLLTKMNEMVQEDQGSTLRIEELERQRDMLSNAMGHVNQVHQNSLDDHYRGIQRIEEASQAQHLPDEELATSLHQELVQLRSDAAHTFANLEHQAQGKGQQLAMEYQRLVDELNQKAHETLQFKMEASQNLSVVAIMKEQMGLMKNEEPAMRDEAAKKMSCLESGAQDLRSLLDREEFAKSETMSRLRQVEMNTVNDGGVSPSALHSEVGELHRRLKQQEELQARNQQAWIHLSAEHFLQVEVTALGMPKLNSQSERMRSAALSFKIFSASRSHGNIFKENDDNGTGRLITHLIEEDVMHADLEKGRDHHRWMRMESEQQARMDELRSELQHAKENEDRLRGDREYWRQEAEYYK
ncbi:unnamed protein product [Symbiodinium microadriaticum]|nr:unnamed protein product [Symbiodinium microadriaticum]